MNWKALVKAILTMFIPIALIWTVINLPTIAEYLFFVLIAAMLIGTGIALYFFYDYGDKAS